jgi:hypothetical protein
MNIVDLLLTQHWETLLIFDEKCEYENVGWPSNEVFNLHDPCSPIWASASVYHIQCSRVLIFSPLLIEHAEVVSGLGDG